MYYDNRYYDWEIESPNATYRNYRALAYYTDINTVAKSFSSRYRWIIMLRIAIFNYRN